MFKNLVKISDLFEVKYGVNLELNSLNRADNRSENTVCFVSRTDNNNGVSAFVEKDDSIKSISPNTITVAGGGSVLATFLQPYEYYSGRDLFYLTPKIKMSERELIYYSICIRKNKYRYSYNRQANRTLRDILIPAEAPQEFLNLKVKKPSNKAILNKKLSLSGQKWKWFEYDDLFDVNIGKSVDLNKLKQSKDGISYVGRTEDNNGITAKVASSGDFKIYAGNCITVPMVGNELKSSYQTEPFCVSQNIAILQPKNFSLNVFIANFLNTIIRKDAFRFAYGRTLSLDRLKMLKIKLPVDKNNNPDWQFMEDYIKSLPYSSGI